MKHGGIKGLLLGGAIVGLFLLGGCGREPVVASYRGHQVTESQFYDQLKVTPTAKTTLANLIVYGALNHAYGQRIDDHQVTADYTATKRQYGDQFASYLRQTDQTKASYKRAIRLTYLSAAALHAQLTPTGAELKAAWATYQPKVTVDHIQTTSRATAEQVIAKSQAGQSFAKLARTYSVDAATSNTGGRLPAFDQTDKTLDSRFKAAAYRLKAGELTAKPITVTGGYEVIRMVTHPAKGTFKRHQAALKKQVYQGWANNPTIMHAVIGRTLKDQHVRIKDADLKTALAAYQDTAISVGNAKK